MHDLGLTDSIEAETLGEPGQRTFNIKARSGRGEAVVWMEKEQLFQVGVSLKQFLATRESTADPVPFSPAHPETSYPIEIEFKITREGKLAIKQARPWVFADTTKTASGSAVPTKTEPRGAIQ